MKLVELADNYSLDIGDLGLRLDQKVVLNGKLTELAYDHDFVGKTKEEVAFDASRSSTYKANLAIAKYFNLTKVIDMQSLVEGTVDNSLEDAVSREAAYIVLAQANSGTDMQADKTSKVEDISSNKDLSLYASNTDVKAFLSSKDDNLTKAIYISPMTQGEVVHVLMQTILKDYDKTIATGRTDLGIEKGDTLKVALDKEMKAITDAELEKAKKENKNVTKKELALVNIFMTQGTNPSKYKVPVELYETLSEAIKVGLIEDTEDFNGSISVNELYNLIIKANEIKAGANITRVANVTDCKDVLEIYQDKLGEGEDTLKAQSYAMRKVGIAKNVYKYLTTDYKLPDGVKYDKPVPADDAGPSLKEQINASKNLGTETLGIGTKVATHPMTGDSLADKTTRPMEPGNWQWLEEHHRWRNLDGPKDEYGNSPTDVFYIQPEIGTSIGQNVGLLYDLRDQSTMPDGPGDWYWDKDMKCWVDANRPNGSEPGCPAYMDEILTNCSTDQEYIRETMMEFFASYRD